MPTSKKSVKRGLKTHPKAHIITWIVFLTLVFGLILGYFIARVNYMHKITMISVLFSQRSTELNTIKAKMGMMNKVLKEGGKVWVVKNGEVVLVEKEITLPDGTIVMANGKYMKSGQSPMMLKEGQAIDLNGNIVTEEEQIQF